MNGLNDTPKGNRIHIGFFGRVNAGKSSLINSFAGQDISVVSDIEGTTTDIVYKSMEISPIGPCVLMDTAGLGDKTLLAKERMNKTALAVEKCDMAVLVVDSSDDIALMGEEFSLLDTFNKRKTPVLFAINKSDNDIEKASDLAKIIEDKTDKSAICVSAVTGFGIDTLKDNIVRLVPDDFTEESLLRNLVKAGDVVMLVMPQDIAAPKGRLILPQVQTTRELLDKKCSIISTTADGFLNSINCLKKAPDLIITDSQVFELVYNNKPKESKLTSFSVLFASYKGDIDYYKESAKKIDELNNSSKVLIAECCTHAPLSEDIGRVKIPAMLKKKYGSELKIDIVSGTDFPSDLSDYSLIIQCGGCMFNKKYILSRIMKAKEQKVPMTNYGIAIAYLKGILDKIEIF